MNRTTLEVNAVRSCVQNLGDADLTPAKSRRSSSKLRPSYILSTGDTLGVYRRLPSSSTGGIFRILLSSSCMLGLVSHFLLGCAQFLLCDAATSAGRKVDAAMHSSFVYIPAAARDWSLPRYAGPTFDSPSGAVCVCASHGC
jgi:hypothetical protein